MPTIHAAPLKTLVQTLFERSGSNPIEADVVADHLVTANLVGHDSHGVLRMRDYMKWIRDGMVIANQKLTAVFHTDSIALVEGHLGYGQMVGMEATRLGVELGRNNGISLVALRSVAHLGRIGHWAEMAAAENMISMHFVSTNGFGVLVAPFGGVERRLSANPFAVGFPRGSDYPIILDISTCMIAEGKIKVARNAGKSIPAGCVVNSAGQPTTDPEDFYGDPPGSILPIAAHKGYGLSFCIELLAGALTGNGCSQHAGKQLEQGMLSIYIDPEKFEGGARYHKELNEFIEFVKGSRCVSPDGEILVPGEIEARTKARRTAAGIPLDDTTWSHLVEEAQRYEIAEELYKVP